MCETFALLGSMELYGVYLDIACLREFQDRIRNFIND